MVAASIVNNRCGSRTRRAFAAGIDCPTSRPGNVSAQPSTCKRGAREVRIARGTLLPLVVSAMSSDTERSDRVHLRLIGVQLEDEWQPASGMGLWPKYLPHSAGPLGTPLAS